MRIVTILLMASCCQACADFDKDNLLPDSFELKKEFGFQGILDDVYCYNIIPQIHDLEELRSFPKPAQNPQIRVLNWIEIKELSASELQRLEDELIEVNLTHQSDKLNRLINRLRNDHEIYFAAYIDQRRKHYVFYECKFFLDIENSELYAFDYIEGS